MNQFDETTMMEIESALEVADSMDGMDDDLLLDGGNELQNENAGLVGRMTDDEVALQPTTNLNRVEGITDEVNSCSRKVLTLKMTVEPTPAQGTVELRADVGTTADRAPTHPSRGTDDPNANNASTG
jgi:hypothetical protein